LELDSIMGRKPPPHYPGTFKALPGILGSWFSVCNLILTQLERWPPKKVEDDLKKNGRRPKKKRKKKKMEDDLKKRRRKKENDLKKMIKW
jgi:hypothetical protein